MTDDERRTLETSLEAAVNLTCGLGRLLRVAPEGFVPDADVGYTDDAMNAMIDAESDFNDLLAAETAAQPLPRASLERLPHPATPGPAATR